MFKKQIKIECMFILLMWAEEQGKRLFSDFTMIDVTKILRVVATYKNNEIKHHIFPT